MSSQSPTIKAAPATIDLAQKDFYEALKLAVSGTPMHKLEWIDKGYYFILRNGTLVLHKPDGGFHEWIISEGDLAGKDYVILDAVL
jgi:hypothetical protein